MDTKQLKQKILDLAIRGKLVPQDPNDEPASVLLERIRKEKEQLIAAGKLKKSKSKTTDTPHYENVPFEIPDSWEWVRLEDYVSKVTDFVASGSFASLRENVTYYKEENYAILIRTADFGSNFNKDLVYTDKHGYEFLENSNLVGGELILPNIGASIGKVFIVPKLSKRMTLGPNSILIRTLEEDMTIYLYYTFLSLWGYNLLHDISSATAQGKFNKTDLKNVILPIPPYFEQKRIIKAVKDWFSQIDNIDKDIADIQDAIKQTKLKVLDLAIHGKLVPQDPNDEPAIELLRRINPHFIPCDTSHYENLPENWGMASIEQLCTIIGGLWTGKKPPFITVGVIRNTNFTKDFKLDLTNTAYLDVEVKQFNTRRLQYGDIILEKSGGSEKQPVGRTILFDRKEGEFSFSNFTAVLRIKETNLILSKFLHFALINAYLNGATRFMQKQTTGIHNLIMDKYMALSVPIPPLAEQKRIVEAIEKVFDQFNSITAEL